MFEIPVGTLDEAFFVKIQGQLDLLVGSPKRAADPAAEAPPPVTVPNSETRFRSRRGRGSGGNRCDRGSRGAKSC
jgi:hypothetical protein